MMCESPRTVLVSRFARIADLDSQRTVAVRHCLAGSSKVATMSLSQNAATAGVQVEMSETPIDLLLGRRSVVAKMLQAPGPEAEELEQILTAALRVPDHKILAPWRLAVFQGDARAAFGKILAGVSCLESADMAFSEEALEAERLRFERAPVVVAVISCMKDTKPVPQWEQILSAGAVCQNMLVAASALGWSTQWVTEWLAYSPRMRPVLGLEDGERLAGFIYIGTARDAPKERARPNLDDTASTWQVPDVA